MDIFFSYIRVFIFLGCTLVGVQVPAFVDQYGKILEAHFIESQKSLSQFQADADKYFSGSFEKLIAHYKENHDQVINSGGESIETLYDRNLMLKTNFIEFQSGSWAAYTRALINPVPDIRKEVWRNFSYAIQLTPSSIAFGLIAGLIFTLAIELLLRLIFQIPKLIWTRSSIT